MQWGSFKATNKSISLFTLCLIFHSGQTLILHFRPLKFEKKKEREPGETGNQTNCPKKLPHNQALLLWYMSINSRESPNGQGGSLAFHVQSSYGQFGLQKRVAIQNMLAPTFHYFSWSTRFLHFVTINSSLGQSHYCKKVQGYGFLKLRIEHPVKLGLTFVSFIRYLEFFFFILSIKLT